MSPTTPPPPPNVCKKKGSTVSSLYFFEFAPEIKLGMLNLVLEKSRVKTAIVGVSLKVTLKDPKSLLRC